MAGQTRRQRVATRSYECEPLEPRRLLAGPHLAWSSYLGGTNADGGQGIAIDGSGNAWVFGGTSSPAWAVGGFDTSYNDGVDASVAKINANGTLAWSSYLGGTADDYPSAIAIDSSGNAWVTGNTDSSGWAAGGFDTSFNGVEDAFVAKINADGTLAWTSYLGGAGFDQGEGIAIDGSGNAWVTGFTRAGGWAVGGFDTTFDGTSDAFVTKINANGTLAWSSYLGGTNGEDAYPFRYTSNTIAIDGSGNAWVTGNTDSAGWAVGGFDTSYNAPGNTDAFIAKINADGTLAWSSYLGRDDYSFGISMDGSGSAWVTGLTTSSDWTVGGFDTSYAGEIDGFVAKINANGTFAWSSYLGGTHEDDSFGIAIDGAGNAWVTGLTNSPGWTVGGFDTTLHGIIDAFIARINANGTLAWSSYLGGNGDVRGQDIAIDGTGNAWVTGGTDSAGWTVGGFDTSYNGGGDAFIAKIIDDVTPPKVVAASYSYETAPNTVRLTFSEDVSASLSASDLIVTPVPGGAPVSVTNFVYSSATNTATFELSTPLGDGNYRARLPAGSVNDLAGHPLAADYTLDFFALGGDANHDRHVDVTDLGILATNWQGTGKNFSEGDFNYDGMVDVSDLGILATNWQKSLPLANLATQAPSGGTRSPTAGTVSPFNPASLPRRSDRATLVSDVGLVTQASS